MNALERLRILRSAALVLAWAAVSLEGAEQVYPVSNGTLADGCIFGPFDGAADHSDWLPAALSYRGSIVLAPLHGTEHRMVFKFDLTGLTAGDPVRADLHLTLRGSNRRGRPDALVQVYSYMTGPGITLSDFDGGPAVLEAGIAVPTLQPPTEYVVDVAGAVNDALAAGEPVIAFRLQIDPQSDPTGSQAFIHTLDYDEPIMPYLALEGAVLGDCTGDGSADLTDYAGFPACLLGPVGGLGAGCDCLDLDNDGAVDLKDYAALQSIITGG